MGARFLVEFSNSRMDEQLSFLSSAAFWLPEWMEASAWTEHAPFAFWLVGAMRPRVFVELGMHRGYSYFVICQAVERLALATRCYAVDTWKGDEHAGFYSEQVFQTLQTYHDSRYSGFSRLIRSTFDDAVEHFGDGTIDLLHVDGRHFYEDVKHDFETWLPKLSERSVVLFHDTSERARDFGVYRYWEELKARFPSFEFEHGHGLGVLATGPAIDERLRWLFAVSADPTAAADIRRIYGWLGAAIANQVALTRARARIETLTTLGRQRGAEVRALRKKASRAETRLAATYASTSWRITAPMRKIIGGLKTLRHLGQKKTSQQRQDENQKP